MKKIILQILSLVIGLNSFAYETDASETLKVWCDPVTLVADGESVGILNIYESDIIDYTAFNMAIIVPEGISIAKVKQGRDILDYVLLSERATTTHTVTSGMVDGTIIKIICGSSTLADFYPDDEDGNPMDKLLTIGLIASPDMQLGPHDIKICDVKFVKSNADACVLKEEPVTNTLIIDSPSFTEDAIITDEENKDIYDLRGIKHSDNPTPGVYIVKKGEEAKKVFIK